MAHRTVAVRRAETGEVLTVEHVPEQCSVKGLAQLLDNKHNLRADETTLLFNGEFRLENALVFDASKGDKPEVTSFTMEKAQNRPKITIAKDLQVEQSLGQLQNDVLRQSDVQLSQLLQSIAIVLKSARNLGNQGRSVSNNSFKQEQAAKDWVAASQGAHKNFLRAFEELKDSFASVDQLYTLIEKTLVDVFKTRIHPAVGDGPLIDLPEVKKLADKLREMMSDQTAPDARGVIQIAGRIRRNYDRLKNLIAKSEANFVQANKALAIPDGQANPINQKVLDLAACEKRIDDTAILLETEIVQLPRVVNNPPQRQASLVKIQELLKSFATSYRALEDIVNDSYDVNVIVSYKVDNVKSIVVPPKKVVQNEDSARQYNKFCKEDVTKSCKILLDVPLNYGKVLLELLHQSMFDQMLVSESDLMSQLVRSIHEQEVQRRSVEASRLARLLIGNDSDSQRLVSSPVDVQVPVVTKQPASIAVRLENVQSYIALLQRYPEVRRTADALTSEIEVQKLSDPASFRTNYPTLSSGSGSGSSMDASSLELALKEKEREQKEWYEAGRKKDAELKQLNQKIELLNKTIARLEQASTTSSGFHVVDNTETSVLQNDVKLLQAQLTDLKTKFADKQREAKDASDAQARSLVTVDGLQKQTATFELTIAALNKKAADLEATVAKLTSDSDNFRGTVGRKEERIAELLAASTKLEEQLSEQLSKIKEMEEEKKRADDEFTLVSETTAAEEERKAQAKVAELQERTEKIATELLKYQDGNEALQQQLKKSLADLEQAQTKTLELEKELSGAVASMNQSQVVNNETKGRLDSISKGLAAAEAANAALNAELASTKAKLAETEARILQLVADKDALNKKEDELKLALGSLQTSSASEKAALEKQVADLDANLADVVAKSKAISADLSDSNARRQELLSAMNQTAQTHNAALEGKAKELATLRTQLIQLNEQLESLGSESTGKDKQHALLQENIVKLNGQLVAAQTQIRALGDNEAVYSTRLTSQQDAFNKLTEKSRDLEAQLATVTGERDRARDEVASFQEALQAFDSDEEVLILLTTHLMKATDQISRFPNNADGPFPAFLHLIRDRAPRDVVRQLTPKVLDEVFAYIASSFERSASRISLATKDIQINDFVFFLPTIHGHYSAFAPESENVEYVLAEESRPATPCQWIIGQVVAVNEKAANGACRRFDVIASEHRKGDPTAQ